MMFRKLIVLGVSALAFSGIAHSAQAANLVLNGGFDSPSTTPKGQFQNINPPDWSCATCGTGGRVYTFVDGSGQATSGTGGYAVYGGSSFPLTSPQGGNFVQADGDVTYHAAITQTITGLTVDGVYVLTFYQAAGQQTGKHGKTTEHWKVSLGSSTQDSPTMTNPADIAGVGYFQDWMGVSMTFVATTTSEVLSFLAVGTPNGVPPTVFLDGVDLEVAEPATLPIMAVGIVALSLISLRRRAKSTAV